MAMELINLILAVRSELSKLGISNRESRKKNEEMIYTIEEIKELLNKVDSVEIKYKTLIYLAIFTGCRREEIMGLEWGDINFTTGEINIERTSQYTKEDGTYEDILKNESSIRSCFVPEKVICILNEYKKWWEREKEKIEKKGIWTDTNRLFIQNNSLPMHPDTPSSWLSKFLKKSNMSHTKFHNLRHMHISILLKMGMDMNSVADQQDMLIYR